MHNLLTNIWSLKFQRKHWPLHKNGFSFTFFLVYVNKSVLISEIVHIYCRNETSFFCLMHAIETYPYMNLEILSCIICFWKYYRAQTYRFFCCKDTQSGISFFKINNGNTSKMSKMCWKFTKKKPDWHQWRRLDKFIPAGI